MPLRSAACCGSVRASSPWPRRDAVGGPKKGRRDWCFRVSGKVSELLLDFEKTKRREREILFTYGNPDGFMVAAANGTARPVVETLHGGANNIWGEVTVL